MAQLDLFTTNQEVPSTSYQRKEFDRYDSPLWFATTLLERVRISGTILEPCVGGGAISDVLKASPKIRKVLSNDIDPSVDANFHLDVTKYIAWGQFPSIDWVVTNPPYNNSFAIVQHAREKAACGVAMALRETWLGSSEDRLIWLEQNKPSHVISMPRYHFARDKNGRWNCDSTAVWWIVWQKGVSGTQLHFAPQKSIKYFYLNPDKAVDLATIQKYAAKL